MFTEPERSPPVPTMSTARPSTSTRRACLSIASARPAISAGVSPLARSATAKAAICDGVAAPDMIWSIAHAVSAAARFSPEISGPSSAGQVCGMPVTR